ncbi:uncharacterized protein LOC106639390 [Copidosoma floridanum]|uniref:uncharacterized protein LOC106639390 n=1 Tax=Copidosoma floridanum TaxID=29053 RepID=UPI0006C974AF|nr:uncharacterized protein LOC106639390 [Copidosoma floridanum]XP_014208476.1 uncharacterized protein LOC106639390 [Copidosoma floridanum]
MMANSSFIQEESNSMKKAHTLVRRVSDMFKDGTYSGPPSLFSQKIRHCCQNLNLFPYLLYSFENSKSHPLSKKVNQCFNLIVQSLVHRFLFVYTSLCRAVLHKLQKRSHLVTTPEPRSQLSKARDTSCRPTEGRKAKLCGFPRQKPKQGSALLVACIHLVPYIVGLQVLGLCSLLVYGKYSPGFIFLLVVLLSMGYVKMKIVFHVKCKVAERRARTTDRTRRKVE